MLLHDGSDDYSHVDFAKVGQVLVGVFSLCVLVVLFPSLIRFFLFLFQISFLFFDVFQLFIHLRLDELLYGRGINRLFHCNGVTYARGKCLLLFVGA